MKLESFTRKGRIVNWDNFPEYVEGDFFNLKNVCTGSGNLDDFYPGGRTQEAIFQDTLDDIGINESQYLDKRDQLYEEFLSSFRHLLEVGEYEIKQLPGASKLIAFLESNPDFVLGLVTGNHEEIARLKLQQAGLDTEVFLTGSFGQESKNRSDLVPLAKGRIESLTGLQFPDYLTIVVGDTTRDVLSAQSVNATSFALTTGTDDRDLLLTSKPDSIFDNLEEVLDRFVFLDERQGGIDGI
jgi:phosphoglycolate phosphatase-like HAD superfamily hydrolase